MPTLSLKKIFIAIIGIIALAHLRVILRAIHSVYAWFCENLEGMNDFSEGAKAAIAFCTLLLIVTLVAKHTNH